jgi:ABC-type multidrug transport system ATPase subunit
MGESIAVVEGVSKTFEGMTVLEDVDLEVAENEVTVLMGPNGAGKTILLSCLAGGLYPTEGDISVLGTSPREARSKFTFMLQGELALPDLTGRENAAFYRDLHPRATNRWRDIAEQLELADDLDRPVRDYSGGMERKLELALTMSVDTPLYLLDEPTSELDLTTINTFHSIIREEVDRGKTVLMTTHTPVNMEIADTIAFVQHGTVVASGNPQQLQEDVPEILTVQGTGHSGTLSEFVREGRFFEDGQERRGFLREHATRDQAVATIPRAADRDKVTIEEPTYTDVFNYYTRIYPDERQ